VEPSHMPAGSSRTIQRRGVAATPAARGGIEHYTERAFDCQAQPHWSSRQSESRTVVSLRKGGPPGGGTLSESDLAANGAVVLITGGTGSFGQTMARRLLAKGCAEVRIFSRDEVKQESMRIDFGADELRFYIGDVRDPISVDAAMRDVDFVFHAAALKQVPSCEFFPLQAVQTNVIGSGNVIRSAVAAGVKSVVCLSTDKAVEPVNAMGMSKALMEKVAIAEARRLDGAKTVISCVRYGNVLYSRGSVVPLFVSQAQAGQPLTVTDHRMTRFMMTLDEAVGLVEHAFTHAEQGDLFIRKAPGALVSGVAEVVRKVLGSDSEIRTIGIRHGEKLHETLATAEELRRAEDRGEFLRVPMDTRELDYSKYFVEGDAEPAIIEDFTSASTTQMSASEIEYMLASLPEFGRLVAPQSPIQ
jgi:UDP-N-acetylglucosamine 4,6-dehydratase